MRDYPHILARLLDEPLLAHSAKAEIVAAVVLRRAGAAIDIGGGDQTMMGPAQEKALRDKREIYRRMGCYPGEGDKLFLFDPKTGFAVIDVTGSLAHRQMTIAESSGVMGYDWIGAQLASAEEDAQVRRIMVDIHTAGGEVAGVFQLADRIAACKKPVIAVANECALSAGYLLGAAGARLYLASETALVGSLGAVVVHLSYQAWLKNEGIKPTIIRSGQAKMEVNPLEDLTAEALLRLQARVDAVADLFIARVARWRRVSEKSLRDTDAGVFMGREALTLGLADGIASPEEIFATFAA